MRAKNLFQIKKTINGIIPVFSFFIFCILFVMHPSLTWAGDYAQEAKMLTIQLIHDARSAGASQSLQSAAQNRKEDLLKLIAENPQEVLAMALPTDVRQSLLTAGVDDALLEKRVSTIEGTYEEEIIHRTDEEGNYVGTPDEKRYLVLSDGRRMELHVPDHEFPFTQGSTITLTNVVAIDDQIVASPEEGK